MPPAPNSLKVPVKVAVLNAWGRWKAWINSFGRAAKVPRQTSGLSFRVAGTNLLECLSGLPFEVDFSEFSLELRRMASLTDVDVQSSNDGRRRNGLGAASAGGRTQRSSPRSAGSFAVAVVSSAAAGPSAFLRQGRYFQLADVMGVEK